MDIFCCFVFVQIEFYNRWIYRNIEIELILLLHDNRGISMYKGRIYFRAKDQQISLNYSVPVNWLNCILTRNNNNNFLTVENAP